MWTYSVILFMFFLNKVDTYKIQDCSPNANIPCTRYSGSKEACREPALLKKFGSNYITNTSEFPGMPGPLMPSAQWKYHTLYKDYFPEVNLSFTGPQHGAVNYLKGFEIVRYQASSTTVSCYIFDISNVTLDMTNIQTIFSTNLFPQPKRGGPLYYELYALPKYSNRSVSTFDQFQQIYIELAPRPDNNEAINWQAVIYLTFDDKAGVINATVGNPPTEHGLDELHFSLYDAAADAIVSNQKFQTTKGYHAFTGVGTGIYQVWVQPYDPYFRMQEHDRCLCRSEEQCAHCITTHTSNITFNYTGPEKSTTASTTTTSTKKSITTPKPTTEAPDVTTTTTESNVVGPGMTEKHTQGANEVQITLAVVGTALGLVIAGVTLMYCIYIHKIRNKGEDLDEKEGKEYPGHPDNDGVMMKNHGYVPDNLSFISFNNVGKSLKFEKRPKLFVLYEEDHPAHTKVVTNFASYLQQYCQCDVMCVEWHLDESWVHQDLEHADYQIIINSEAAFKTYMPVFGKKKFSELDNTPPGSRRMSSINSIRNKFFHEECNDNILMVYFDYTDEKYILPDICPGFKYKLMKHFSDFLLRIHKIHRADPRLSQYDLPLDGNHLQRPFGQKLLEAIAEATQYERENPDWAVKRFTRMYSYASDDSRHDSGLQADFSPGNTPVSEKFQSWPSAHQAQLLKLLEGQSVDALTIDPSLIGDEIQNESNLPPNGMMPKVMVTKSRSNLRLDPQSFVDNHPPHSAISSPSSPQYTSPDDFLPPDDIDQFDRTSKTISEQMVHFYDIYKNHHSPQTSAQPPVDEVSIETDQDKSQASVYDRDHDLYYLKIQSGEIPFIHCSTEDTYSLGGESV